MKETTKILLLKLGFLIGLIIYFIFTTWRGAIGFLLGIFLICYLVVTDNPKFLSLIMIAKLKAYSGGGDDEDYKIY